MTDMEILQAAKYLISDPAQWTQQTFARDGVSEACDPCDPTACKWCAQGAVYHAYGKKYKAPLERVMQLLDSIAMTIKYKRGFFGSVFHLNDLGAHAQVMELFDKAIEHLDGNATEVA